MVGNANANGVPFIKNGTSFLKDNIVLWYDLKRQGATNENMANNPILKDFSGNGHDATCYNFAWSGMSGIGGYVYDLVGSKYSIVSNNIATIIGSEDATDETIITSPKRIIGKKGKTLTHTRKAFDIKVSNLPNGINIKVNAEKNNGNKTEWESVGYLVNGINHVDEKVFAVEPYDSESTPSILDYRILFTNELLSVENIADLGITIEILPLYPNALVSDGVNDYAYVEGLPILTDYTIIAKRKWLDDTKRAAIATKLSTAGSTGAFAFEFVNNIGKHNAINFGYYTEFDIFEESDISYQTKTSYNGTSIYVSGLSDTNLLNILSVRPGNGSTKAALYSFVLFNRTLTDEEIKKWIRENMDENYLLPNERLEPIIYYDFRNGDNSNLTTITDLSGNERHGTMYNFTGEADSGYSDGCLKFNGIDNYIKIPYSDDAVYKTVILLVRVNRSTPGIIYDSRYGTGLTTGIALFYGNRTSDFLSERLSDNAKLYVNGVTNTSYTNADMKGKKCCVAVSDDVLYSGNLSGPPNIGTVRSASNWFSDMKLYAFLGFDKILTEEEIRYVMNKYNLLEGIDEI